ncbi:response regulator transcription factor [Listeria booriae]|uniref:response regulator transcription factor n=1 Tax=Listeria booriae TaxID=1552123 RepID=UPI0016250540|nr:response regulator transcription factor [Listeria booriae]MBC2149776.1 response regulator transcription factor [Listeria booriae]
MKVYLLDDHSLFSKSLEIAFQSKRISISSFIEPSSLFSRMESARPDIVILDIHIGEFNGFDISKEVLEKFPSQKIVFLSGFDLIEYKNEAIKSGAWAILNKNLTIEDLHDNLIKVYNGTNLLPNSINSIDLLTEREKEILKLAAEGITQQRIADCLHISRRTVNNHLLSVYDKLDVNSTVSAIIQAIELGIIRVKGY